MDKNKEILQLKQKIKELEKEIKEIPKQDILDVLDSDYESVVEYYETCVECCNPDSNDTTDEQKSMWYDEKERSIYHNYIKVYKWLGFNDDLL